MIIQVGVGVDTKRQEIPVEIPEPLSNAAGEVVLNGSMPKIQMVIDPALKAAGISSILSIGSRGEENGTRFVEIRVRANRKEIRARASLNTRPELEALLDNCQAIREAIDNAREAIWSVERAAKKAEDDALLAGMEQRIQELVSQVPAGHTPIVCRVTGQVYDGGDILEPPVADGVVLGWQDVTPVGWANAIRPGAINSFASAQVLSISAERLAEVRAIRQAAAAEKAAKDAERQAKRIAEEERRAALKSRVSVRLIRRGSRPGEGGPDPFAEVELTDTRTGEKLGFRCQNIFDFGYTTSPAYAIDPGLEPGGMAVQADGTWHWLKFDGRGWIPGRALTEFELACIQYLDAFPPISNGMRM
jgi:hypothetical protein